MRRRRVPVWLNRLGLAAALALAVVFGGVSPDHGISVATPAAAQVEGQVPGGTLGGAGAGRADMWRSIREGHPGTLSTPRLLGGVLVQTEGESWRNFRNGPLQTFGVWLLVVTLVVLAVYFVIYGRIRIHDGFDPEGRVIHRFNQLERSTHWLVASSFIVLAITGLNLEYGRYILPQVIGEQAFATLTAYGKYAHNFMGFAFIVGLVLMFVLWVKNNLPERTDLAWLARGGGMFGKGQHPPAGRFNAGQKIIFWIVILGGGSLCVSGIALIFPFKVTPWSGTFAVLNLFGANLPTHLTPLMETQLSVLWHSFVAILMIAAIVAHIYIGSLGIEGALDAVTSGDVDRNWARMHHSLWVEEMDARAQSEDGAGVQPAE